MFVTVSARWFGFGKGPTCRLLRARVLERGASGQMSAFGKGRNDVFIALVRECMIEFLSV